MDQYEFSRRLRLLAGPQTKPVDQSMKPYTRILGSLGMANTVRRLQAVVLSAALAVSSAFVLRSADLASTTGTWGMALIFAAVGLVIVRRFPYWTPAGALHDGLITLSSYQLNDLGAFLQHQRTDLTTLNNTLLSDLCMQLAMDRRRPVASDSPRRYHRSNRQGITF